MWEARYEQFVRGQRDINQPVSTQCSVAVNCPLVSDFFALFCYLSPNNLYNGQCCTCKCVCLSVLNSLVGNDARSCI